MIEVAEANGQTISQVALAQTAIDMDKTEEFVKNKMRKSLQVMREAIQTGLDKSIADEKKITGPMAYKFKQYVSSGKNISGGLIGEIIYNALATSEVNACMGKVVAAPTAGSCGIIPACLITLEKHFGFSEDELIMAMINASAIGMVIAKNASISGAEGGCQAECGSSAAMAASAITELMGGTPTMCGHAVAQALKSLMGLVCDPVAGLVEEPCIIRNSSSAVIAVISAEYALAEVDNAIPVDEVIETMGIVGRQLPSCLRETAEGGIAGTPTAKCIHNRIFKNSQ